MPAWCIRGKCSGRLRPVARRHSVLFHNHPSGDPTPSPDDVALTARLVDAGTLMGIEVLDHLVLGDVRYYSFKESGRIG